MQIDHTALTNPQDAGFQTVFFDGSITDSTAMIVIKHINRAIAEGKKGIWMGINSGGGSTGSARVVHDYLKSTGFPAIAHVVDTFSEGSSLATALPQRTIAPAGKIGFHQTGMNLVAGVYAEGRLSDLLQQVKGHNRAMIGHLALSLGLSPEVVSPWVYDGAVFVGQEAKAASIVHEVLTPHHPRPNEHWILEFQS